MGHCEGSAIYLDPLLVKLFVQSIVIISLISTKFHHHLPSQTPTINSQSLDAERGIVKEVQARGSHLP